MHAGAKGRQVRAGWEHQHVGVPNGDDSALAAATEQHPDHPGKQGRRPRPGRGGCRPLFISTLAAEEEPGPSCSDAFC